MHCQFPCIAKHVLYSCLRTLKYRTLAHLSFTNTIQTLRILKPLCHPAPGTAAATRPCSQITLGRLVSLQPQLFQLFRSTFVLMYSHTAANVVVSRVMIQADLLLRYLSKLAIISMNGPYMRLPARVTAPRALHGPKSGSGLMERIEIVGRNVSGVN